jgi:hypothetical protein
VGGTDGTGVSVLTLVTRVASGSGAGVGGVQAASRLKMTPAHAMRCHVSRAVTLRFTDSMGRLYTRRSLAQLRQQMRQRIG